MMTYKEILSMVSDTTYTAFYKGLSVKQKSIKTYKKRQT